MNENIRLALDSISTEELTLIYQDEQTGEMQQLIEEILATRGGPATRDQLRNWLGKRRAARELAVPMIPDGIPPSQAATHYWLRYAPCACGTHTKQLLHGYTESGGLWKGHECMCRGWECTECGRIVDRQAECCR